MSQNTHHRRPLMVQAPVRALDLDGVAVVTTGTIAFAIGAVVCWWFTPELVAAGKQWYFWVSVLGTVIGLLGLAFGMFRKSRRKRGRRVPAGADDPMLVEMIVDDTVDTVDPDAEVASAEERTTPS